MVGACSSATERARYTSGYDATVATALLDQNNYDAAIGVFGAGLAGDPSDAQREEIRNNRGLAYLAEERSAPAITDFDAAIALDTGDMRPRWNEADALLAADRPDAAIAVLEAALREKPDDADTHFDLGRAYAATGQYGQAVAALDAALARRSYFPDAHVERGLALLALGRGGAARAEMAMARQQAPDASEPARGLAILDAYEGRAGQALDEAGEAVSLDPGSTAAFVTLAEIEYAYGRFARAAADAASSLAIDHYGNVAELTRHLAQAHLGQDDHAELAAYVATHSGEDWPAPLLAFLAGRIDEATLSAAAAAAEPSRAAIRRCQVDYVTGELAAIRGDREHARAKLTAARDSCPRDFVTHIEAQAALGRLGG